MNVFVCKLTFFYLTAFILVLVVKWFMIILVKVVRRTTNFKEGTDSPPPEHLPFQQTFQQSLKSGTKG